MDDDDKDEDEDEQEMNDSMPPSPKFTSNQQRTYTVLTHSICRLMLCCLMLGYPDP